MKIIDIGVNLLDPMFRGIYRNKQVHASDTFEVLQRAYDVGVEKIIITCGNLQEAAEAQDMIIKYPNAPLYSTVGVHPTRAHELQTPEYLNSLLLLTKNPKVIAIGECGLDYDRLEFCPKDIQIQNFIKQFTLSKESGLPMFFHNRNSTTDFIQIIKSHRHLFSTGVVHSFDASIEEANELIALDLYIGINGCSLKNSQNLNVVKEIPLDRLMIETDAPWCDIRSTHASFEFLNINEFNYKSKKKEKFELGCLVKGRNEPCTIIQVLQVVSALKGIDINDAADVIYENTRRVFF